MDTGLQETHLEEQRLHIYPMPLHVVLTTVPIDLQTGAQPRLSSVSQPRQGHLISDSRHPVHDTLSPKDASARVSLPPIHGE